MFQLLFRQVPPTPLLTAAVSSINCHTRPSHGRATRSRRRVEAIHFEAQADASDDANAVAGIDSDADAEYETDPSMLQQFPLPRRGLCLSTTSSPTRMAGLSFPTVR